MSDEWKEELLKMKGESEKKKEEYQFKEKEIKEKYKGDIKKILDMIRAQCEPVVETFKEPSKPEFEQPSFKIIETYPSAFLKIPLTYDNTSIMLTMTFELVLTTNGYSIKLTKELYDSVKERVFSIGGGIRTPVNEDNIRKEIREYIKDVMDTRQRYEERRRRF